MSGHKLLTLDTGIAVYVAHPGSSWERGTNENTNGLLRQYLPKGTDLSGYTQRELNAIAHRLNTRPRKCLNFATPLEVYGNCAIIHPLHFELETAVPVWVHLVGLVQPNNRDRRDRPDRPHEQVRLADLFSILLVEQDGIEGGSVHVQAVGVLNEAELLEPIHKETHS